MTVIYESPTKVYKTPKPKPKRYEVQWFLRGRYVRWSWHRYRWAARLEVFIGFERMRIIDHGV